MSEDRRITFLNLIDKVLIFEKGGKTKGDEVFRKVLIEYFFKEECDEKKVMNFIKGMEFPPFITDVRSLIEIDMPQFEAFVNGSLAVDSLAAKILLSKQYLQIFHRNHPPEISKMPADVQLQIMETIKIKNGHILSAFQKMHQDMEADKQRTVMSLVALILKNIRMRNGVSYNESGRTASDVISGIFRNASQVFTASAEQVSDIGDDKHIKLLIKEFCVIRKNSELSEMADLFKQEFERYRVRAEFAASR